MTNCEKFIKYVDDLIVQTNSTMPDDVAEFYNMLCASKANLSDKPAFTESGLMILEYLQGLDSKGLKAKEIADGMDISSRKVSGAMRKLVTDGYVEKFGQNPVIYAITEKGKNFNINDYKENM